MSVVETVYGKVEGASEDGILSFRGIPFASPPTGELRFRAPQPPASWSGVRPATEYARAAPQRAPDTGLMAVGPTDEDCLYLNVDTPALDDGRRPVFVWIHGGGFTAGASSQTMYRGGPLAPDRDRGY